MNSRPAATPVCRSSRSIRPCADTSRRPAPPLARSKSWPRSITRTSSCQGGAFSRGSRSRTAKSGRSNAPPACSGVSSSGGTGQSSVPAYPFGEKLQPSTSPANSRKSGRYGSGSPWGVEAALGDAGAQEPLPLGVARENGPRPGQGRRRHHETGGPDEADPLQVRGYLRVELRHALRGRYEGEADVVALERRVGGHQCEPFHLGLRHQHPVERIAMVQRQRGGCQRVDVSGSEVLSAPLRRMLSAT